MSIETEECMNMLRMFIQKGFIYIEECEDQNGIKFEKYSLEPLWGKLFELLEMAEQKNSPNRMKANRRAFIQSLKKSLHDRFLRWNARRSASGLTRIITMHS